MKEWKKSMILIIVASIIVSVLAVMLFHNAYISNIFEDGITIKEKLGQTEEEFENYSNITTIQNHIALITQDLEMLGYIDSFAELDKMYAAYKSNELLLRKNLKKLKKREKIVPKFEELGKIIEKIFVLKKSELENKRKMAKFQDDMIKKRDSLEKYKEMAEYLRTNKKERVDKFLNGIKIVKDSITYGEKNNINQDIINTIDRKIESYDIASFSIYEIEELWNSKEISVVSKIPEINQLKFYSRELFSTSEDGKKYIEKINTSSEQILESIRTFNKSSNYTLDIVYERAMIISISKYRDKLKEYEKLMEDILQQNIELNDRISKVNLLQFIIDNKRNEIAKSVSKDLNPKLNECLKMIMPVLKTTKEETRAFFNSLKGDTERSNNRIREISQTIMLIIILGLVVFIVGVIFVFNRLNSALSGINKGLEKNVEERTALLKENINRLRSIEKMVTFIYSEKDKKRVIDYVMAVMTAGLNYKKAVYFTYEESLNRLKGELICYNYNLFADGQIYSTVKVDEEAERMADIVKNIEINFKEDSFIKRALLTGKPYISEKSDRHRALVELYMNNFILLPVIYEKTNYGMLVLERIKNDNCDMQNELEILKIFASNLAIYFENRRLEEDNLNNERIKTMFQLSSAIVHELRTPLTAIRGLASLLRGKYGKDSQIGSYTDMIIKETARVDGMASDLLDYADGSKETVFRFEKQNLLALIQGVIKNMEDSIISSGIFVEIDVDEKIELYLDKNRFNKSIQNIVKNSIEASKGHDDIIRIEGVIFKNIVIITIKDNGIGIPENIINKIFEPLVSTKLQGTGLGLTIVKDTIRAHNGKIAVKSHEGAGTEVTIEIET